MWLDGMTPKIDKKLLNKLQERECGTYFEEYDHDDDSFVLASDLSKILLRSHTNIWRECLDDDDNDDNNSGATAGSLAKRTGIFTL